VDGRDKPGHDDCVSAGSLRQVEIADAVVGR
jgi:hypothetical protein